MIFGPLTITDYPLYVVAEGVYSVSRGRILDVHDATLAYDIVARLNQSLQPAPSDGDWRERPDERSTLVFGKETI